MSKLFDKVKSKGVESLATTGPPSRRASNQVTTPPQTQIALQQVKSRESVGSAASTADVTVAVTPEKPKIVDENSHRLDFDKEFSGKEKSQSGFDSWGIVPTCGFLKPESVRQWKWMDRYVRLWFPLVFMVYVGIMLGSTGAWSPEVNSPANPTEKCP